MARISRRDFLKTNMALAAAPWLMKCAKAGSPIKTDRPNIILYVTDDQGYNDAGCYGHPVVKTPGLDYLATEGVRFTHAFSVVSSCSPSRASILTGLHTHANGQYGLHHQQHNFNSFPDITSLPLILAEAGYRTIVSGKYHIGPKSVYSFQQRENNYLDEGASYILPEESAELCREHIEKDDAGPFFLYFCPLEPHYPFRRQNADHIAPEDVSIPPYLADTSKNREKLAKYCMSIQQADQGLVRLIEILKESGKWDNTIIICCSDNGAPFPGAKTTLYDPGIRLPFVMRVPQMGRKGATCEAMISYVDIAPTLLDLAGVTATGLDFQGRSFASILDRENPTGWDEVYASQTFHRVDFYYPMRAVRTRRHKLIWNIESGLKFPGIDLLETLDGTESLDNLLSERKMEDYTYRPMFELYDLEQDPNELKNCAGDPQYRSVFDQLSSKLKTFVDETNDLWAYKWPTEQEIRTFHSDEHSSSR